MAIADYVFRLSCAMFWKSWRSRRHHLIRTLMEIAAPVLLVIILVAVKAVIEDDSTDSHTNIKNETTFPTYDINGLLSNLCNGGCRNLRTKAVLAYAPSNNVFLQKLMEKVQLGLSSRGHNIDVLAFPTEMEIEGYAGKMSRQVENNSSNKVFVGAVIFPSKSAINPKKHLAYKLRLVSSKFITGKMYPDMEASGPAKQFMEYEANGFMGIQLLIDKNYIEMLQGQPLPYSIEVQALPYPPYVHVHKSHYATIISTIIPAAIIFGFGIMFASTLSEVTHESTSGIKDLLTMLGMNNVGYWIGWYLSMFLISAISVSCIVPILTMNIFGEEPALFLSSPSLLWFIMYFFAQSSIWFCFFISRFFRSCTHTSSFGFLLWISSLIIPALLVGTKQFDLGTQLLVAILPTMNLYWCFSLIANWESKGVGAHWRNTFDFPNSADSLSLSVLLTIQVFSTCIFLTFTLCGSHSSEHQWKLKKPWKLFVDVFEGIPLPKYVGKVWKSFRPSYGELSLKDFWIRSFYIGNKFRLIKSMEDDVSKPRKSMQIKKLRKIVFRSLRLIDGNGKLKTRHSDIAFQDLWNSDEACLIIRNLTKTVSGKQVLRAFICDFHPNEITAIVGPPGSGKTTLINLITGMLKMDGGAIYVNNYNTHEYLTEARRNLSLCPQTPMLFDELTVAEHICMFSYLKGMSRSEALIETRRLIHLMDFKGQAMTIAAKLSAEHKKLLNFTIAISGDSKIVLLDDPIANVGSASKRLILNAMMDLKTRNKAVVFTCRSIEDAKFFASRMGVLLDGRLQCFGKYSYLQARFGNIINVKLNVPSEVAELLYKEMERNFPVIDVKGRKKATSGEEITFCIPNDEVECLPKAFDSLQSLKTNFKINKMMVSRQSVQEYFDSYNDVDPNSAVLNSSDGIKDLVYTTEPHCVTRDLLTAIHKRVSNAKGRHAEAIAVPNLKRENIKSYYRKEILKGLAYIERREKNRDKHGETVKNTKFTWSKATEKKVLDYNFSILRLNMRSIKLQACYMLIERIGALLSKLYLMTKANTTLMVLQIFLPVLLLMSGIWSASHGFRNQEGEHYSEININLLGYEDPITLLSTQNKSVDPYYYTVVKNGQVMYVNSIEDIILKLGTKNIDSYRRKFPIGIKQQGNVITAMFSTVPYNAAPLALNLVSNMLLNYVNSSTIRQISISNHPMPSRTNEFNGVGKDGQVKIVTSLTFYFSCALAAICAIVAVKPNYERRTRVHHIQMMSGMSSFTFWGSYFVFDGLYILFLATLSIIAMLILEDHYLFSSNHGIETIWTILMASGFMCLSFTYFISHVVVYSPSGFSWFNMAQLFAGLGCYFLYRLHDGVADSLTEIIYWLTSPFPIPLTIHALHLYSNIAIMNSACNLLDYDTLAAVCSNENENILRNFPAHSCCRDCQKNCFEPKSYLHTSTGFEDFTILRDIIVMLVFTVFYVTVLIMEDMLFFKKICRFFTGAPSNDFYFYENVKDDTAIQERCYVQNLLASGTQLGSKGVLVDGLCKNYCTTLALSTVSFCVKNGDCLGIMGVKDSGKTSLLKILTGAEIPTLGNVYLDEYNLLDCRKNYMSAIGYCPMENALLEDLTCRELLIFFARIRGVSNWYIQYECSQWLLSLGFENMADTRIKYLNPSKKRLLSVAIAMIGEPLLVVVDEPSMGVDPADCKALWNTIQKFQALNKPVIIASEDADECQHVCKRVGILVNGILDYIGEPAFIKSKFVKGMVLTLYLDRYYYADVLEDVEIMIKIREVLEINFPCAVFKEQYENVMKYVIPDDEDWKQIFTCLSFICMYMDDMIHSFTMSECTFSEVFQAITQTNTLTEDEDITQLNDCQSCIRNIASLSCCKDYEFV